MEEKQVIDLGDNKFISLGVVPDFENAGAIDLETTPVEMKKDKNEINEDELTKIEKLVKKIVESGHENLEELYF